ncbi:Cytochrome c [Sulfidibacter corallicola]|uniref:Cytochrome c n=1 Tax=Sulfidibacter corallicola TaxID=2818388 RepID=A0A8A4TT50_SULCO|nr:cytochrome c [Sulfidibacter corallicola]QTD53136.1 cytochrome c [Sulfidibacter corallicola]
MTPRNGRGPIDSTKRRRRRVAPLFAVVCLGVVSFIGPCLPLTAQDAWVAPASAKTIQNPKAGDRQASAAKGKKVFQQRCTVCHGSHGKGDGPGGKALTPKPANLTSARVQNQADGELFWKISNGRGPMVSWQLILPEDDRWNLVNFLRTLK